MKFGWFHLMPYRELPPDFADKHRSVWVDVPSSLFDGERAHSMYHDYLDELEFAARVGFDGVCVNEHHQNAYGLMPSPNLMAAALSRRTSDVAIIVLGNSIALYNPPVRVAEEFAMLDCLTGGRLVAGFPVGTAMDDAYCYGENPALLRRKYYEANDLIIKAWTEPDIFSFNGEFTQLRYVNPWPRPIQKPHPPVWIPGGGSVETWDWCADKGYVYAALSYGGYKAGQRSLNGFWTAMQTKEKPLNPYQSAFLQLVCCGASESEVEDKFAEHAEYFYNKMLHVWPGFADPPGYRSIKSIEAGFTRSEGLQPIFGTSEKFVENERATQVLRGSGEEIKWRDLLEAGNIIAGTPSQVTEQLEDAIRTLHTGHMLLLCQFGSVPHQMAMDNTQIIAEQVLPNLRDIWGDEAWEDHWWPTPMRKPQSPAALTR
jgi:alkanesulfonate monooxygenase SsuD/methylene tetrahydromethanopterin reductase-like flavin-dependent oxidoreductase (luciferase family)